MNCTAPITAHFNPNSAHPRVVVEMARLSPASSLQVTGDCVEVHEGERDGEALLTLVRAIEVYNVSHN